MEKTGIRRAWQAVYCAAAGMYLCWDLARMTEFTWTFTLMPWLPQAALAIALVALLLDGRKRPALCWVMAAGLAWMLGVSAWWGGNIFKAQLGALEQGVIAFLVLAPLRGQVGRNAFRRMLLAVLSVWTALMTVQALLGLWAALDGHAVFSMKGTWYIGMNRGDHRLYLNAYVTTGAVKMGLAVLLTLLLAAMTRKKAARVLLSACAMTQMLCLSLTDCRTAFLALGGSLGWMGYLLSREKIARKKRIVRLCVCVALVLSVTAAVYGGMTAFLKTAAPQVELDQLDNLTLMELPSRLLPSAEAEEVVMAHREIEKGNVFNDRQYIWEGALRLLQAQPGLLATGCTQAQASALMNLYAQDAPMLYVHAHSLYLQTLVCWGIPGLLLLLAGVGMCLVCGLRTVRAIRPMWVKMMTAPVLYLLVCELVDCFTLLSTASAMLYFLCLFMGALSAEGAKEART